MTDIEIEKSSILQNCTIQKSDNIQTSFLDYSKSLKGLGNIS
jgi:hypothetical protein